MIIFLALLFYLLATESDPLASAADLLPLSDSARLRASHALTISMRGVFVACIKLSAFHALFTWLSLSASNVHLVYMSTVASAVSHSSLQQDGCFPRCVQIEAAREFKSVLELGRRLLHYHVYFRSHQDIVVYSPNAIPFWPIGIFDAQLVLSHARACDAGLCITAIYPVVAGLYPCCSSTGSAPGQNCSCHHTNALPLSCVVSLEDVPKGRACFCEVVERPGMYGSA
jgi:hypothetical protein